MGKRKLTAQDLLILEVVANPAVSPDGTWVVYEQQAPSAQEDGYNTQLNRVPRTGGPAVALTSAGTRNARAAWSPDGGTIAFVSNRSGSDQIWLLSSYGGEARRLTHLRYGADQPKWSADGQTIFCLARVSEGGQPLEFAADATDEAAKAEIATEDKDWADAPKRFQRLTFRRDGDGLERKRSVQLLAIDVKTGKARQLTFGPYAVQCFDVAADGRWLAFISNRRADPDKEHWGSDVFRVATAGGDLERITIDCVASDLTYAPDGTQLAVLAEGPSYSTYQSATHKHLFVVDTTDRTIRCLTTDFPDTVSNPCLSDLPGSSAEASPVWSPDGRFIYALSAREGRTEVVQFAVDSATGSAGVVAGGDREIRGFALYGGEQLVMVYTTPIHPSILATVEIGSDRPRPRSARAVTEPLHETPIPFYPTSEICLLDVNAERLSDVELVQPEAFFYESQDGWRMQGWLIRPVDCAVGKRVPTILEIHGGPQMHFGYAMFHELQWFAAAGFAVVYTNPRGGTSYGQSFANGVRHHYGDGDAADILNGLDAALSRFDCLDPDRVAVTGGSYGGFMTNWLVGHTNRFFAAVSQRSISNWISFLGVSDIGPSFCAEQHGVGSLDTPTAVETLWRISPLAYAANVQTPLLLIHSENDLRCPIEQAEQFYTALKTCDCDVELLRIPHASHGLSRNGKPNLRIARLNAILDFIRNRLP